LSQAAFIWKVMSWPWSVASFFDVDHVALSFFDHFPGEVLDVFQPGFENPLPPPETY